MVDAVVGGDHCRCSYETVSLDLHKSVGVYWCLSWRGRDIPVNASLDRWYTWMSVAGATHSGSILMKRRMGDEGMWGCCPPAATSAHSASGDCTGRSS
jgi:hypothetical protein